MQSCSQRAALASKAGYNGQPQGAVRSTAGHQADTTGLRDEEPAEQTLVAADKCSASTRRREQPQSRRGTWKPMKEEQATMAGLHTIQLQESTTDPSAGRRHIRRTLRVPASWQHELQTPATQGAGREERNHSSCAYRKGSPHSLDYDGRRHTPSWNTPPREEGPRGRAAVGCGHEHAHGDP